MRVRVRIGPGSGQGQCQGTGSGSGSGTALVLALGLGLGRKKKCDNSNFDRMGVEGWREPGEVVETMLCILRSDSDHIHNAPSIFFWILNILHPLAQNVKRSFLFNLFNMT